MSLLSMGCARVRAVSANVYLYTKFIATYARSHEPLQGNIFSPPILVLALVRRASLRDEMEVQDHTGASWYARREIAVDEFTVVRLA